MYFHLRAGNSRYVWFHTDNVLLGMTYDGYSACFSMDVRLWVDLTNRFI